MKIVGPNSLQLCLHAVFWGEWIISGVNGKAAIKPKKDLKFFEDCYSRQWPGG